MYSLFAFCHLCVHVLIHNIYTGMFYAYGGCIYVSPGCGQLTKSPRLPLLNQHKPCVQCMYISMSRGTCSMWN